ncbi:MAG: hypothetical protein Q7T37_00350 [bacterium]|nr:hypothetical protein [bacterium]MDO8742522.1 hypothetical protein [bacterium]
MKSVGRIALVLVMLLVPVLALAQQSTGAFRYDGVQGFSGGSMGTFGFSGIFPGGGGGTMGGGVWGVGITILAIINGVLVPVLFAVSFIVFLYGVAKAYIFSNGDEGAVETGHKIILWGLIGFAAMVSVWGLVNVVVNTFGLGGIMMPPPTPTSYSTFGPGIIPGR